MNQFEKLLKLEKKVETYTVEQIENLILDKWKNSEIVDDELESYLSVRQRKINSTFEWTPENIEKLLLLNQKLITCFEKLRDETKAALKTLQKRMDEKDSFLHDFEIEATGYTFHFCTG